MSDLLEWLEKNSLTGYFILIAVTVVVTMVCMMFGVKCEFGLNFISLFPALSVLATIALLGIAGYAALQDRNQRKAAAKSAATPAAVAASVSPTSTK